MVSFPSWSFAATPEPREFSSVQQHTANYEIDVPATYRVLPWLRAEALIGFTEQQINWNVADCATGNPCLEYVSQDAIVAGAGAQAFYRRDRVEVYADLAFRVPVQLQSAHALFAYEGNYTGQLSGGETIALAAGVARRVDTARFFVELGYLHSVVSDRGDGIGLSASFGGFLLAGGISLW